MSVQKQTPPTQAAKPHPMSRMSNHDLAESKLFAERSAESFFYDGDPSADTPEEDVFIFSNMRFKDLWDVCTSSDAQPQPEMEVKELAITKLKNGVDSESPASGFKSYRWASSAPIPGRMQTIGPVPLLEEGLVGESALSVSQGLPERVLGLTIVACDHHSGSVKRYLFLSKLLCQLNPLMLPVMDVHSVDLPSETEWKLRDLLAQRKEKLRVLILLLKDDVETVLLSLERFGDLLSDVTTVVLGNTFFCESIYVLDLTHERDRLKTIAMLVKRFTFQEHDDDLNFMKTMTACTAQNESWRVVEATIGIHPSLHECVSAYPRYPNIYFSTIIGRSMNREVQNKVSTLVHISDTRIDLSKFRNLRSLMYGDRFVNSALQQPHGLHYLCWLPQKLTLFDECAWECLSNLRCLSIDGDNLHPHSRISLQWFPKLASLSLNSISQDIVVDFGHLPWRLNELQLGEFQGSLEGDGRLQVEKLVLTGPVCDDAYLQLCPKSEKVEIKVRDIRHAYGQVGLVGDQLKCLKLWYGGKLEGRFPLESFPFSNLGKVFPLLESLELACCSVMLSSVTFPRLHHLSLIRCDVCFPECSIAGQYGDTFPELEILALTDCKLLLDGAVPNGVGQNPVRGVIHINANSLFSLKLFNVIHLSMLQIHRQSFPCLQNLHCHIANDDDFPFPMDEPGVPLFPHLRNLSLKKDALGGKKINLDLLADIGKLERLELLDNAFFTLDDMKPFECRWVHFSSAIVEHENSRRRFPGGMPVPMESTAEKVTFAIGLVSEKCEKLIFDQHVVCLSDRQV